MRAYDAGSIPGLRRPRSDDARVARWVSDGGQRATERLVRLIATRPAAGNAAAACIRRALADDHLGAGRTLDMLDALMRRCPYFYRYIAYPRFFAAMWGVHKSARATPDSRGQVLLLMRAWAEDLGAMFVRRADPPAAFWIDRYQRKRRHVIFPGLPTGTMRPFVCPVRSANSTKRTIERGHVLNRSELEASLALLERLLSAAKDARGWGDVAPEARRLYEDVRRAMPAAADVVFEDLYDSEPLSEPHTPPEYGYSHLCDDGATLLLPRRAGPANEKAARAAVAASRFTALNGKVLAVLRRYDDSFARFEGRRRRSSTKRRSMDEDARAAATGTTGVEKHPPLASVAAVAREEARWKLFMNAPSTLPVDADLDITPVNSVEFNTAAFTPATFPSSPFSDVGANPNNAS